MPAVASFRARASAPAPEMPSFSSGASPQKQQHNARRKQLIRQQRKSLPIASVEKRLVDEVRKNDTLIVVGETGSGKTTRKCFTALFSPSIAHCFLGQAISERL
ncbi:unnamed protein product [Triticum turgidum subsp. durum]|uniref:RNA helicase n=1 Tax=Triticum turgidum subsp. durum TaxID=4567 RepID=A0A9R0ZTP8_TRITD|nr:unnamed protein product [Triticum turgidum subsp. durum]